MLFAWFTPGPMELAIIGVIAVLLFGSQLPKVMKNLGKGLYSFKGGMAEGKAELDKLTDEVREGFDEVANDVEEAVKK